MRFGSYFNFISAFFQPHLNTHTHGSSSRCCDTSSPKWRIVGPSGPAIIMASFLDLPAELLLNICTRLGHRSLKRLRLTSKHFSLNAAVTEHLFSTFQLFLFKDSMNTFINIAHNDHLCRLVKKVVFRGDVARTFKDQQDWEKRLWNIQLCGDEWEEFTDQEEFCESEIRTCEVKGCKKWHPKHQYSDFDLQAYYDRYEELRLQWHHFNKCMRAVHDGIDSPRPYNPMRRTFYLFTEAIRRLVNLDTVAVVGSYDIGTEYWCSNNYPSYAQTFYEETLWYPRNWRSDGRGALDFSIPRVGTDAENHDYWFDGVSQLSSLLTAISTTGAFEHLKQLRFSTVGQNFWDQKHLDGGELQCGPPLSIEKRNSILNVMAGTFKNLRTLEARVLLDRNIEECRTNERQISRQLARFLLKAECLEHLFLSLGEVNPLHPEFSLPEFTELKWYSDEATTDFLSLIQDVSWPSIRVLEFDHLHTTRRSLQAFASKFPATLQILWISQLRILGEGDSSFQSLDTEESISRSHRIKRLHAALRLALPNTRNKRGGNTFFQSRYNRDPYTDEGDENALATIF
ncbi:hypothetical protein BU16DRAFT_595176 [Lophium mytilinum]|uniref:F-box domain-containing protein n=1 Tax=Lophium mytilinum TaxID=390894 RepID=A0A6A6QEI2_9PEZI|nr:hypothetical protein BU16DRAFT_595176 [Lophium mytilinum]